jgi:uncharacterized protein YfkK (UPF0435 family)
MPTVSEILEQMLAGSAPEAEKTAAETTEAGDDVASQIAKELNLSSEEVDAAAQALEETEKKAEAEKKAEEAELIGRFMARGFIDELNKVGGALELGSGQKVQQQADASTPQDGGKVLSKVKAAVEKLHTSAVPDKVSTMNVVKKVLSTARKVKAPVTAVETNA